MHRSRLVALVIDCKTDDLDTAADFWSRAVGRDLHPNNAAHPTYRGFIARPSEPMMMVQSVDHDPRVHLDIESDDVEAEVTRLEKLGAKRVTKVKTWWVMEAPTGHRFCVVEPQRGPLGEDANQWP